MIKTKLIIWDLDWTLLEGSIFYKDDKLSLKQNATAVLKELNKRKIKQAICSKNYLMDAIKVLEKYDILKYFEALQIDFKRKSIGIKNILDKTKVSEEETMFIDDDSFQRAEVGSVFKNMKIRYEEDLLNILDYEELIPDNLTESDKKRTQILREQNERIKAEKDFEGSFKDFLKLCNTEIAITKAEKKDLERVWQLANRTNELNIVGNRWSRQEVDKIFENEDYQFYIARLKDKFGDYGIIAEMLIEKGNNNWFIRDLAVSCRTMGRGVGSCLVAYLITEAKKEKIEKLFARVRKTEYNDRMTSLFVNKNFKFYEKDKLGMMYVYKVDEKYPKFPEHIKVI